MDFQLAEICICQLLELESEPQIRNFLHFERRLDFGGGFL